MQILKYIQGVSGTAIFDFTPLLFALGLVLIIPGHLALWLSKPRQPSAEEAS